MKTRHSICLPYEFLVRALRNCPVETALMLEVGQAVREGSPGAVAVGVGYTGDSMTCTMKFADGSERAAEFLLYRDRLLKTSRDTAERIALEWVG